MARASFPRRLVASKSIVGCKFIKAKRAKINYSSKFSTNVLVRYAQSSGVFALRSICLAVYGHHTTHSQAVDCLNLRCKWTYYVKQCGILRIILKLCNSSHHPQRSSYQLKKDISFLSNVRSCSKVPLCNWKKLNLKQTRPSNTTLGLVHQKNKEDGKEK